MSTSVIQSILKLTLRGLLISSVVILFEWRISLEFQSIGIILNILFVQRILQVTIKLIKEAVCRIAGERVSKILSG